MASLADGGRVNLEVEETVIEPGIEVDTNRPAAPVEVGIRNFRR